MDFLRAEGLLRLTLVTQKIARCLASDVGLTVNEFHCMTQLYLEKPCCVGTLTDILGIGSTTTSKLLHSLDKKKLITRSLDETDRRVEIIALTPAGTDVVRQIMQEADSAALILIEQLPHERRIPFSECVHTVTQHIKTLSIHNQKRVTPWINHSQEKNF